MTLDLLSRHCREFPAGTATLKGSALDEYMEAISERWKVIDGHHLEGEFEFPDFAEALAFTNRVGAVAEAESHHPEITLTWGKVSVQSWTHSIGGLSPNDFILAARIDALEGA